LLDKEALNRFKLTPNKVVENLNEGRLKDGTIVISSQKFDFKALYKLKERLKETPVSGVKGIKQILVVKRGKDYVILAHGSNLKEIFEIKGVDKNRTRSNDIYEIAEVLGIEAARKTITDEINKVIEQQGLSIDQRYVKLIADAMTMSGVIKGSTRMGMISEKKSILARASFETPIKHFVNATISGTKDELASVIENTMLNQPIPVGTGLPGLLVKVIGPLTKPAKDKTKKAEESDKKPKE